MGEDPMGECCVGRTSARQPAHRGRGLLFRAHQQNSWVSRGDFLSPRTPRKIESHTAARKHGEGQKNDGSEGLAGTIRWSDSPSPAINTVPPCPCERNNAFPGELGALGESRSFVAGKTCSQVRHLASIWPYWLGARREPDVDPQILRTSPFYSYLSCVSW